MFTESTVEAFVLLEEELASQKLHGEQEGQANARSREVHSDSAVHSFFGTTPCI